ncbi:helix-turn-helix domain-containing protein [Bifidobacterium animalis]|uniref:helix-turn-helix domain-containing protein n=1 Tax=Bifidobacterium animalis TaxID=28025 RepID=UPI001020D884|nr:helix-turn-helix transcriptional regulator [Bifidobacterium animalis]RYN04954.1 DNA-binding helix-turn-helix protein [Bifidobacterium animalis subsp. lactis]
MDMNEAVSRVISAERSAAKLTIKELAEKSGIPERTLIRVLKGERDINVMQISKLAPVFGIYPHELIESAESFVERDRRGSVANLSGVDEENERFADITDGIPSDFGSWQQSDQVAFIAEHPDLFDLAAKHGDTEAEQEAFEEQP